MIGCVLAQVLLVAGGLSLSSSFRLASTELLVAGAAAWVAAAPLPAALAGPRAATVAGSVLLAGGETEAGPQRGVWRWTSLGPLGFGWEQVGSLQYKRSEHAVSAINMTEQLMVYCR